MRRRIADTIPILAGLTLDQLEARQHHNTEHHTTGDKP